MTNKNIVATAKTAIACALASTLTLGAVCAPALAATTNVSEPVMVAQSDHMSEGEAVWFARTYLRIAPENVRDLDVDLEMYGGKICFEVEIQTFGSDLEHHVMVDAYDGTILGYWVDD